MLCQFIIHLPLALGKYKLRGNILAPLLRKTESIFLNDTFSVSLYPKPLPHKAYLATPLRVIPSFLFDDPQKDYLVTPLMTNPTMASQWDSGNFKSLDMSKIPGYPRQMPPRYEKWFPRFTGSDEVRADNHMDDFWAFFQLHPISDDAEYLEMKLFSTTLHGNSRKWYDDLPDASITSMDQLEEMGY